MRRLPEAYHIDITILNKKSRVACFEVFSRLFSSLSPRFLSLALFYFIYFLVVFFPFLEFLFALPPSRPLFSSSILSVCRARIGNSHRDRGERTSWKVSFSTFSTYKNFANKHSSAPFVAPWQASCSCVCVLTCQERRKITKSSLSLYSIFIRKFHAKKTHFFFFFLRSLISSFLYLSDVLMCIHTYIYVYICIHIYMHVLCILKY